jgi:hypothetical protein
MMVAFLFLGMVLSTVRIGFILEDKAESGLRNFILNKRKAMDNAQKANSSLILLLNKCYREKVESFKAQIICENRMKIGLNIKMMIIITIIIITVYHVMCNSVPFT